ncbi:hypothetical protein J1605_003508 [Eschrichtius robustus]|uniref:Uncharacterized protein n=1 Tax=Eschrichtius robustus TaxID=9764 RepID=A0AB34HLE8_ESCRO|nr:hypothetical protein J1605_003508 [Eschrichtius robustus]
MPGLLKAPPAQRSEPIASGTALDVARPDSESRRAGRTRTPFSVGFRRTLICRRRRAGVRGAAAVCLACAPGSAAAMGILEKISEIEKEIARTQKNKGEGRPGGASAAGGRCCRSRRGGAGGIPRVRIRARPGGRVENPSIRSKHPTRRGGVGVRSRVSWRAGVVDWRTAPLWGKVQEETPPHRYSLASFPEHLSGVEAVRT